MSQIPLILASESPNRLSLLSKIRITPSKILPANIDETEYKNELPGAVALRLATEKARKVAGEVDCGYIIAADSVAAVGRRILPKALNDEDIKFCLNLLSGKRHRIYTGVTIIKKENSILVERQRLVQTILKFKRLTDAEIEFYLSLKEGLQKAGGYSIQGFAESFVEYISGSFSNVVGLPLFEVRNMLISLGYYSI